MAERKTFRVVGQRPEHLSPDESQRLIREAIERLQKVERDSMGREEVIVSVGSNDPIMIIAAADLHAGSIATDYRVITELRDFVLKQKNVGVILLGDEVEGLVEKYLNTNTARTPIDFHQQIDFMRTIFLEPLARQGKILAIVGGYWGHPGWAEDATTINTWRIMTDGLNIPVLQNGGRMVIRFPNKTEQTFSVWHNPSSTSPIDPVKGLRDAALATSEPSRTGGYWSGHVHRSAVAQELYSGAKTAVYYISAGTAKGSSPDLPSDRYGVKMGKPRTDPLGQGVILEPRRKGQEERNYPFMTMEHGETVLRALTILESVEKQGMTAELLEKIRKEVEDRPKVTLLTGKSRVSGREYTEDKPAERIKSGGDWVENPYSGMRMRPPYADLHYDVQTVLPIAVHLLANARIGSSSEGLEELQTYQRDFVNWNPHSLVVYLRNMIDRNAGSSPERMEILDRFKEVINGTREQTLAIMMCESLREGAWRRPIRSGEELVDGKLKARYLPPIAPASYLANETRVPLIHHLSMIRLTIGPSGVPMKDKPMYTGAYADKLLNRGSGSKPEYGLRRVYDLYMQNKPGYVAGGHMPHAGSMLFYDGTNIETKTPILVAPGWFAHYVDTMGKGNVMPGAAPGQAIIFMPGANKSDYLAFPTVNADETGYMQDALTLLKGLEILGLREAVLGR